jgi:hypothetical protein
MLGSQKGYLSNLEVTVVTAIYAGAWNIFLLEEERMDMVTTGCNNMTNSYQHTWSNL